MWTTLILVVVVVVLAVAALLAIEGVRYKQAGKDALITSSMRQAVKNEPWVFILLALISGFMMGHCFGQ